MGLFYREDFVLVFVFLFPCFASIITNTRWVPFLALLMSIPILRLTKSFCFPKGVSSLYIFKRQAFAAFVAILIGESDTIPVHKINPDAEWYKRLAYKYGELKLTTTRSREELTEAFAVEMLDHVRYNAD